MRENLSGGNLSPQKLLRHLPSDRNGSCPARGTSGSDPSRSWEPGRKPWLLAMGWVSAPSHGGAAWWGSSVGRDSPSRPGPETRLWDSQDSDQGVGPEVRALPARHRAQSSTTVSVLGWAGRCGVALADEIWPVTRCGQHRVA